MTDAAVTPTGDMPADPILEDLDAMRAAYLEMSLQLDRQADEAKSTAVVARQKLAAAEQRARAVGKQRSTAAKATKTAETATKKARADLREAQARILALEEEIEELQNSIAPIKAERDDFIKQVNTLVNSRRWKITEGLSRVFHALTLGVLRPRGR